MFGRSNRRVKKGGIYTGSIKSCIIFSWNINAYSIEEMQHMLLVVAIGVHRLKVIDIVYLGFMLNYEIVFEEKIKEHKI